MMMIQDADVARLLEDDKAFGRAMAYLIAYVRRHAGEVTSAGGTQ